MGRAQAIVACEEIKVMKVHNCCQVYCTLLSMIERNLFLEINEEKQRLWHDYIIAVKFAHFSI